MKKIICINARGISCDYTFNRTLFCQKHLKHYSNTTSFFHFVNKPTLDYE